MQCFLLRAFSVAVCCSLIYGCSSYQPTKNVWKGTKSLWYTYVSPPASVDYEDKGTLSPRALALTSAMMGIDMELGKLERVMLNADKPPTREWMNSFFNSFPWIGGFAGVKYDGTILGREPANSMKQIDFIPLLYEDSKQNSHALRGDVQNTASGPEVLLATPLYDGIDFLGIVAAHFDFRSLIQYSQSPQNMVVLSPYALLWPGEYDFASTPLAGIDWNEVVTKSSSGRCSNANGSFYYMVRYLGNLPLIFAVAENDNFPKGDGRLEQGMAFFPQERPKMDPPPRPERKDGAGTESMSPFEAHGGGQSSAQTGPATFVRDSATEIQPGNKGSVLMQQQHQVRKENVQERQLEGENIEVERIQKARKRKSSGERTSVRKQRATEMEPVNSTYESATPSVRPSPFGPTDVRDLNFKRPSPFGPTPEKTESTSSATSPESEPQQGVSDTSKQESGSTTRNTPATLPGGRPSPFGPK